MYAKQYTILAASKNETLAIVYTVEIWTKDFTGYEDSFDPADNPMTGQILPSGDDPFDPFAPSTLTLLIDITDFTGDLPDFTSRDDRLYWVKVFANNPDYYVWQGFILMDAVNVPFTTGRIFLELVCTDGLALLANIPYVPTSADFNVTETVSTEIINCLNLIALPDGYTLNLACNIYAQGMDENFSTFSQTYIRPSTWLQSDGTYETTYTVLSEIARGYGCQVYQSDGQWWVGNINERAEDSIRFFVTNNAGASETKVVRWKSREIMPWTDITTTPWYFQDNIQTKILRKGYPVIEITQPYSYSSNSIYNGNLKILSGGWPVGWTRFNPPGTTLSLLSLGAYTYWQMGVSGFSGVICEVQPDSLQPAFEGDFFNLSFSMTSGVSMVPIPSLQVRIKLSGLGVDYALTNDGTWQIDTGQFYDVYNQTNQVTQVTISGNQFPISGTLEIFFRLKQGVTLTSADIANFTASFTSQSSSQFLKAVVIESSYKKQVSIRIGAVVGTNNATSGALMDITGAVLINWYRFGITEAWSNLTRIIIQQYVNVVSKAQINFDMTVRGLFDPRNVSSPLVKQVPHIIGLADVITVNDTTTNNFSVAGTFYMTGATNFNYTEDTMNGTVLQISDVDLTATITNETIAKP